MTRTLRALRADQWLENHPEHLATRGPLIKQQMRDAFYTDTDEWKRSVVSQAAEAVRQAVTGLSGAAVRN